MTDESGYSSIADTSSMPSTASSNISSTANFIPEVKRRKKPGRVCEKGNDILTEIPSNNEAAPDIDKIEEKISEIFDSMNFGKTFPRTNLIFLR